MPETLLATPEICPRCGGTKFSIRYVPGNEMDEVDPIDECDSCGLTFDGERWKDELGVEWVMAESGE